MTEKINQKELNQKLYQACLNHDLDAVIKLIDYGADVNSEFNHPPFEYQDHLMINLINNIYKIKYNEEDYIPIFQKLIEKGSDKDISCFELGISLLDTSILRGKFKIAQLLVKLGAEITETVGETLEFHEEIEPSLFELINGRSLETIQVFIECGAALNCINSKNQNLLEYSIARNFSEMIDFFKTKEKEINQPKIQNQNCFSSIIK